MKRAILAAPMLAVLLAAPALAAEPGLAELKAGVAQAVRENPQAFQAVAAVRRGVPSLDQKRRGPIAAVSPLLKAQKQEAFWPLVAEVLDGLPAPEMLPRARIAWAVGVLEALGALGDARAAPAVKQALLAETEPEPVRAAAAALGQVDPQAADVLVPLATKAGPKQLPVISGLAECRTLPAARALSELAGKADGDAAVRRAAAKALGELGSAWVWQTSSFASRPEREEVREVAARGLVAAFVRSNGEVHTLAERSLLVVDFGGAAQLVEKARAEHPGQAAELDRLARRLAANPLHPRR